MKIIRFLARHIEFVLISLLIVIAAIQYFVRPQSQSYEEILDSGKLRVLITDEPDSQYVFNKQHYGFEYELLATFARSLDVELELIVVPYGELFTLLDNGMADIAVGGILDTSFVRRVSQPTTTWYQAKTTVVYKRGTPRPKKLEEFQDSVLSSARYYEINDFESFNLIDDFRSEYSLLNSVANGENRFALTTDYRARNAQHYLPNLNRSFILPDKVNLVWVLPKRHDEKLLAVLNQFLQTASDKALPKQLADYYLGLPRKLSRYDASSIHKRINEVLPNFEYEFRNAARKAGIDWTLLAAISYQESRWSNEARSPTGVRGIMQLTNETASYLGVDDRMDMTQTIDAAARYVVSLKNRLPKVIKEPERTWFAVAAYNLGYKHVIEAYKKARERGLNKTQWNSVSQLLPKLYGVRFSQGIQAKNYVERVQIFTDILRFYDIHQREQNKLEPLDSNITIASIDKKANAN